MRKRVRERKRKRERESREESARASERARERESEDGVQMSKSQKDKKSVPHYHPTPPLNPPQNVTNQNTNARHTHTHHWAAAMTAGKLNAPPPERDTPPPARCSRRRSRKPSILL